MWRTHSLRWQLLRGVLMVSCSLLAFYCLQRMPVAEFTATVMLTPLVLTALARFVMKETVSPLRWLMVAAGWLGLCWWSARVRRSTLRSLGWPWRWY
jgi:drug/metabolite transporter (DMT)-like permease